MDKYSFSRRNIINGLIATGLFKNVSAQVWSPNRAVTFTIPFTPGGLTDIVFRNLQKFADEKGIKIVAEYKPGAEGLIGMQHGSKQPTDGHSITLCTIATVIQKSDNGWQATDNYRLLTALRTGYVFVVTGSKSGINSFDDLLSKLRNPASNLTGGSGAPGQRIFMNYVFDKLKVNATITNYKGNGPLIQDLIGNHIQFAFLPAGNVMESVKNGSLKLLANDRPKNSKVFNDVPNITEYIPILAKDMHLVALPKNTSDIIFDYWLDFFKQWAEDNATKAFLADTFNMSVPIGPKFLIESIDNYKKIYG